MGATSIPALLATSYARGMLWRVSRSILPWFFSTEGFGTRYVRKRSLPSLVLVKKWWYFESSFSTTWLSTSFPSESHICSRQPSWENTKNASLTSASPARTSESEKKGVVTLSGCCVLMHLGTSI